MNAIHILLFLFIDLAYSRYLIVDKTNLKNNTSHDIVEEVQHAVCRVATEEIQASANASITRQLKGVCSTSKYKFILFCHINIA